MLISLPAQQTVGVVEIYVHYTTDGFHYSPPQNQFLSAQKKEISRQILYNNLSICPRKWSPYNTHHREAKDTQVKSTLKSRLSTNQTLSNRLVGAVWCFVSSSLIEGDLSVFDGRGNTVHSDWVQTNGWTWWYIVPGPPSRRSLLTGVLPVKTGLKPAQTDQTPAVPPKSPQSSGSERREGYILDSWGFNPWDESWCKPDVNWSRSVWKDNILIEAKWHWF